MAQYEFALENSLLIHVKKAQPHSKYKCANNDCTSLLIPIFGDTGREHHFRHLDLKTSHEDESELHYNTKHMMAEKLRVAIDAKTPIIYNHYLKNGTLFAHIDLNKKLFNNCTVVTEKSVSNEYRPDIAILENSILKLSVEIIHTHDIDAGIYLYLKQNKLLCIKIHITHELYHFLLGLLGLPLFSSNDKNFSFINFIEFFELPEEKEQEYFCDENDDVAYDFTTRYNSYKDEDDSGFSWKEHLKQTALKSGALLDVIISDDDRKYYADIIYKKHCFKILDNTFLSRQVLLDMAYCFQFANYRGDWIVDHRKTKCSIISNTCIQLPNTDKNVFEVLFGLFYNRIIFDFGKKFNNRFFIAHNIEPFFRRHVFQYYHYHGIFSNDFLNAGILDYPHDVTSCFRSKKL